MTHIKTLTLAAIATLGISFSAAPVAAMTSSDYVVDSVLDQSDFAEVTLANGFRRGFGRSRGFRGSRFGFRNRGFRGRGFRGRGAFVGSRFNSGFHHGHGFKSHGKFFYKY